MSEAYKQWQCRTCGHIYDEAEGAPDDESHPARAGPMCPTTGSARSAARPNPTSTWWKSEAAPDCRPQDGAPIALRHAPGMTGSRDYRPGGMS